MKIVITLFLSLFAVAVYAEDVQVTVGATDMTGVTELVVAERVDGVAQTPAEYTYTGNPATTFTLASSATGGQTLEVTAALCNEGACSAFGPWSPAITILDQTPPAGVVQAINVNATSVRVTPPLP